MLTIKEYTVESIRDPYGILSGQRYEFRFDLDVPEEDELYVENGVYVKTVFMVDGEQSRILSYHFYEASTDRYLDFDMEPEEEEALAAFCKEHLAED
ncbi:DUF6509 family protein [Paenibacillus mendelii]|uniref:DUF6509 family protein n=1 Tax=Paenibacillus mendelii TaxID=206163 RepID=A0ABV6J7T8_9BACL|nr:DUF6509 family protein [Paenibacillus mendelii]MCQ6561397.1 DUF6509 family protein [Paenibacillus mendelii]